MFPKYKNISISLFSIHFYHSSKLACFEMCQMIGGNFKTIDFGFLVYKMLMDSFFLAEPIDLVEVKAKDRFIKILKSSVNINLCPKRRYYCIKKKLFLGNMAKISAPHARNLLRMTLCFFPCKVLNKHGFFFVNFSIASLISPMEMGKSKLYIRG